MFGEGATVSKSAGHHLDGSPPLTGEPLGIAQPMVRGVQKQMVLAQQLRGAHIKHC